ncbi:TetR/AcrR family transcriptional regulator [Curtobacterium flaccumfaciens]|uniref:TetR/AcrR family transcriptional regulator n=1 Tax=Curtobacterium flaccumfaciens TaxID=2035 RepID=UPI001F4FF6BA|nr:TetR/AcrR family transcriptional regulator [Curtobacterium flaccumfaciens]MCS0646735.1 TetR/AcrR family transcriptional regulator [Curtobacterium flaccumfaciens pv. flaccumfaciens]MCS6524330.1 TetR/AcrR family transcriptional regulator [Curtobacterium flaccumfaciens pv. flaccumfaciens]MCS6531178.1 TetR/AcrR family transcriptional regulator [Curtobacterium flaccumfaciens pv. flaccumfaciens]
MSTTERTRALRRRMIVEARRATVEHGLHGFTIEQLCETVGVSRRTFFNHFGSKDDAVLGIELNADVEAIDAYAAGGIVPGELDPLGSIVALAIDQFGRVGFVRADEAMMRRVFEREPALVARFLSATDVQLARVTVAVRRRFGWDDPGDRRARLVTEAAAALLKVTAETYFDDAFDESTGPTFDALLTENLRLLRAVTTTEREHTT